MKRPLVSLLAGLLATQATILAISPRPVVMVRPALPPPQSLPPPQVASATPATPAPPATPAVKAPPQAAGATAVQVQGVGTVQTAPVFSNYLSAQPQLLTDGVKVVQLPGGKSLLLSTVSVPITSSQDAALAQGFTTAKIKVTNAETVAQHNIELFDATGTGAQTTVTASGGQPKSGSVAQVMNVQPGTVQALAGQLSVVASWTSKNGTVLHVTTGVIRSADGYVDSSKRLTTAAQTDLQPFITAGQWQPGKGTTNTLGPVSLSALRNVGALNPTTSGLQMLLNFGNNPYHQRTGDESRPRWNFSSQTLGKLQPNELAELKQAQTLLRTQGDDLVAAGLLAP